jgi:hypothetical protein
MRIMSVRPASVARVFTIIYAVGGLASFIVFAFSDTQILFLPIGIVTGIFHLSINIPLARSPDLIANVFLCMGFVFSNALTGFITGLIAAACFNLIAKKTGGIDAKFASVSDDETPIGPSPVTAVLPL